MAKITEKFEKQHVANITKYGSQIDAIYKQATQEAAAIAVLIPNYDPSVMFRFEDYPMTQERVRKLLRSLYSSTESVVINGINAEWTLANNKNNELSRLVIGNNVGKLTQAQYRRYFSNNDKAREAFIARKEQGLDLSDKVWRYTNMFKNDIEMGLDLGLRNGLSAFEMSRDLRQYLKHPDMLFRRVRDEHGDLVLSQRAKDFHPGQGVYRSSYMNARRLTVTETNIAYRTADYERVQQMDFVVGIEVCLSNNHNCKGVPTGTFYDICDMLAGKYPKAFKFTGWHPHCRCHTKTILKTPNELMAENQAILDGKEPSSQSVNSVDAVPAQFANWIKNNEKRIETARQLPYFLRDNGSMKDGKYVLNDFIPSHALSLIEIADARHAGRTKEQIDAIQSAWNERKHQLEITQTAADNILTVAQDYAEVDYSELQHAMAAKDYAKMKELTKSTAQSILAMKNEEKALSDLIPDVHSWHKQFSMAELKQTYAAVEKKLASWSTLTLEQQAKKLDFEADKFLGGNMNNVQSKYATWKVSQAAYFKKYFEVMHQIEFNAINDQLAPVLQWSAANPKYKKIAGMLSDVQTLMQAKGYSSIIQIKNQVQAIEAEYQKNLAKVAKKNTKHVVFTADDYTQARKDAALWTKTKDAYGLYDRQPGDDYFRPFAERNWKVWDENQKDVAYLYTSGSSYINEPLYTKYYNTKFGLHGEIRNSQADIATLTDMIDKSEPFTRDVWLNRGASAGEFLGQFGLSLSDYTHDVSGLIGKEGFAPTFLSTAHSKSWGFVDNGGKATHSVVYNLYCPQGTKGIYAEPYSAFGSAKRKWDGKTKYSVQNEVEVILQRNTKLRVTKAEYKNGQWFIDLDVIGQ